MENKSILGTVLSLVIVVALLGSFLAPTIAAYQYEMGTVEYNDAADASWLRLNYGDDDYDVTFTIDSSDLIVNDQTGAANDMIVYADESSCILCKDGGLVLVNGYADTPAVVSADAVTVIKSNGQIQITADDVTVVSADAPAWAYYPDENGIYAFFDSDVENVRLKEGDNSAFAGNFAGVVAYNDYVIGPNGVGDLGLSLNADIVDNVINSVTWARASVDLDSRAINDLNDNRGDMVRSADPSYGVQIGDLYYTFADGVATLIGYSSSINWTTFNAIPDSVTNDGVTYPVTRIGSGAFSGCTNLALTSLPDGITYIGSSAFSGCTNLALTSLPDGITTINQSAFRECTNLALTSLPDGITSLDKNTFYACTNLALTSLPDNLTSIGEYCFIACPNLELTYLPSGLNNIDTYAFSGCTNLESLVIQSSPTITGKPFNNTGIKEVLNLGSTEITTTSYGLNADEVRSDVPAMGYIAPLEGPGLAKKTDAASELLSVILLTTIGGVVLALVYTAAIRRD